jgi:hypothetical protein
MPKIKQKQVFGSKKQSKWTLAIDIPLNFKDKKT